MTIPITDLVQTATSDAYLANMLTLAGNIGIATTSWQEGDPSLTILEIISDAMASRDAVDTAIASGGLLDYASTVTPEPVRGQLYTPGWLDMCCDQLYDTQRLQPSYAKVGVSFVNATGSTITYAPLTYHVQDSATPPVSTYSNPTALVIPIGSSGPFQLQSDVIGAGQVAPTTTVSPVPLLTVTIVAASFVQGADTEGNAALIVRARDRFKTFSLGGPAGAYDYLARTIPVETPAKVFSGLRSVPSSPVTRTLQVDIAPGVLAQPDLTMYCGTAAGAYVTADSYTDSADLSISLVAYTGGGYTTITTLVDHGLADGDNVYLSGIGGLTACNNTESNPAWSVVNAGTNTFDIALIPSGSYTTGGTVYRVSDLDLVKKNLILYCVPEGVLVGVYSVVNSTISLAYAISVRAAGATQNLIDRINAAITTYMGTLPIGGLLLTGGSYGVPFGAIVGTIWLQDPTNIVSVHVWLGGVEDTDWVMTSTYQSMLVASLSGSITPQLVTDSTHVVVV